MLFIPYVTGLQNSFSKPVLNRWQAKTNSASEHDLPETKYTEILNCPLTHENISKNYVYVITNQISPLKTEWVEQEKCLNAELKS